MEVLRGMQIKIARIQAGLKQKELAQILSVNVNHLNMVENGKRESYKVRVLATEYFNKQSIPSIS
jgi:transcriptional regulator with XRE-family HTH domain